MTQRSLVLIGIALVGGAFAWTADDPVAVDMELGAGRFLRSLDEGGRSLATIDFDDEERYNFHYIPRDRQGLPYKSMTPAQRKLASAFVATGLSHRGMARALDIMYLDQILFEIEKRAIRDPEAYYLTIFGEPASRGEWGWRLEGHHLSLNFTVRDGRVASSFPSFMGANPASVPSGAQKGMRVLAEEELLGRALFASIPNREEVVIDVEAPSDVITASNRRVEIGSPTGLSVASMNDAQRDQLRALIALYAHRLRPELAANELDRIERAGFEQVYFAWAGGGDEGDPHYYRIHGPTFLIEYDNTQNNANHIHTVWRDPTGDWGETDPLSDHYAKRHAERHQLSAARTPSPDHGSDR